MKRHILVYSLLLLALFCPAALKAGDFVIINQVMYDTPKDENAGQDESYNGEFFELYNGGTNDVSLDGWTVHSLSGTNHREVYTLPDITISAGGYLIFASRQGKKRTQPTVSGHPGKYIFVLSEVYESLKSQSHPDIVYYKDLVLANKNETLILMNAQRDTMDMVSFGSGTGRTASNKDNTPGDDCRSIHRTGVELDDYGRVIVSKSQWSTSKVSFGGNRLPNPTFGTRAVVGSMDQEAGKNYVLRISPLDAVGEMSSSDKGISVSADIRTQTTIQCMDGLGRTEGIIALGATPQKKDLVTAIEHLGSVSRQWLPVVASTEGQSMNMSSVRASAQEYYSDNRPYTETRYESLGSHKPVEQIRPGIDYKSRSKKIEYGFNTESDEVRIYTVVRDSVLKVSMNVNYPANTLHKTTVTDEDGHVVTTYTDQQGRKIMEELAGSDERRTYYVYNDLGRLCFVLPHIYGPNLCDGEYRPSDETLRAGCYCYKYDKNGNMIYKRLPGCDPQYMVYDKYGQLVLKQDGNQRKKNKWTQCAYDSIGRNLYTCEIYTHYDEYDLRKLYADKWAVEHLDVNTSDVFSMMTGYGNTIMEVMGKLLVVNYYDNYGYMDLKRMSAAKEGLQYDNQSESEYGKMSTNTDKLLTGTRVYNLSGSGSVITAYYYDQKGRVIQTRSVRGSFDEGFQADRTIYTKYNFDGSIAETKTIQSIGNDKVTEHYAYTYDHAGRAKNVKYKLNNKPEVVLSEFFYDETGRLAQNLLYNSKDKIEYLYDMRNMLTYINNKHFTEKLMYAEKSLLEDFAPHAQACYNGNIAASIIEQDGTKHTYNYKYNELNYFHRSVEELTNGKTQMSEEFDYDLHGNVRGLWRFRGSQLIDRLELDFDENSNQVTYVWEDGEDADAPGVIEYTHRVGATKGMTYDKNGNMKSDYDRGITRIVYNLLNLPDTVYFLNGNKIVNQYNAAGQKCKTEVYTTATPKSASNSALAFCEFETDSVDYVITEHFGSVSQCTTPHGSTQHISNSIGFYCSTDDQFYHYVKDHLGNVRVVVNSATGEAVQSTQYYASGVPMIPEGEQHTKSSYMYNGKEFVEAHGYNVYDYGFREYYATIGRFTTMDPLAEMTPWKSPYSYAGNNFVNKIDYMGLFEDYPTNPDGSPCYDCPSPSEFVHNNDYEWKAFNKDGSLNEDWWYENGYLDGGGYNWGGVDFSSLGFNPYDINLSFIMLGEKTLLPGVDVLNWIAVDGDGNIVGMDLDHWDKGVYQVDGKWDGTHWGLMSYKVIGTQSEQYMNDYKIGDPIAGKYDTSGGGYMLLGHFVKYGTSPASDPNLMLYAAGRELYDYLYEHPMVADVLNFAGDLGDKVSKIPGLRCLGWVGYLLAANQFSDLVKAWQSGNVSLDLKYHTVSTAIGFIPGWPSKGVALLMDGTYIAAEKATDMSMQFGSSLMNLNTWGNLYNTGELPY